MQICQTTIHYLPTLNTANWDYYILPGPPPPLSFLSSSTSLDLHAYVIQGSCHTFFRLEKWEYEWDREKWSGWTWCPDPGSLAEVAHQFSTSWFVPIHSLHLYSIIAKNGSDSSGLLGPQFPEWRQWCGFRGSWAPITINWSLEVSQHQALKSQMCMTVIKEVKPCHKTIVGNGLARIQRNTNAWLFGGITCFRPD